MTTNHVNLKPFRPAVVASLAHHSHTQPMSTKSPAPNKPCHPATLRRRRPVKRKPPHHNKPRQPEALPPSSTRQLSTPRPHATHVYHCKSPFPNKPCHPATRRPVKRKPPHDDKPRQPEALHPAALASLAHHGHTQPMSTKSPAPNKPCHPATRRRRPVKRKPPHHDKPRQPEALPPSSTRQLSTPRPHATHVYQEPCSQQTMPSSNPPPCQKETAP